MRRIGLGTLALLLLTPALVGCLGTSEDTEPAEADRSKTFEMTMPIHVVGVGFESFDEQALQEELDEPMQPFLMQRAAVTGDSSRTPLRYDVEYRIHEAPEAFAEGLFSKAADLSEQAEASEWLKQWDRDHEQRICDSGPLPDTPARDLRGVGAECEPIERIDAEGVEAWIAEHRAGHGLDFGDPGYTVFVLNPHAQGYLSTDTYHQYAIEDGTGFQQSKTMRAWGGAHDFVFLDAAAAPSSWDYHPWMNFTRDGLQDMEKTDPPIWATEDDDFYDNLARNVYDAARILWTRKPIYPIEYAERYVLPIHVIVDRTAFSNPDSPFHQLDPEDVEANTEPEVVQNAFERIVPWAEVEVNVTYTYLPEDDPELADALEDAKTRYNTGSVDFGVLKHYFRENWDSYVPNASDAKVYPSFAFWLSDRSQNIFAYSDSDAWGDSWGVFHNFADVFLCARPAEPVCSYEDVFADSDAAWTVWNGILIHELGHSFGLNHPHDTLSLDDDGYTTYVVNWLWDSTSSMMTYRHYQPTFSSFDEDMVRRSVTVNLATGILAEQGEDSEAGELAQQALDQLEAGDGQTALDTARQAHDRAQASLEPLSTGFTTGETQSTVLDLPASPAPAGEFPVLFPLFLVPRESNPGAASWPIEVPEDADGLIVEYQEQQPVTKAKQSALALLVNDEGEAALVLSYNVYDRRVLLETDRCDGGCELVIYKQSGAASSYEVNVTPIYR